MRHVIRYFSGRKFGDFEQGSFGASVRLVDHGEMLVEFRYEYQGQRYQGPKAEDARWSDLPELSSFRMKNVAAIRWLAANLSEAADAIERGAKYQQVSEMFRDAER